MSRANEPAYPVAADVERAALTSSFGSVGMTLREHFAGLAMQGLLANPGRQGSSTECAEVAVMYADALIAELEKTA